MDASKRGTLALLGLAPMALSIEAFSEEKFDELKTGSCFSHEQIAKALRTLADLVEGKGAYVSELEVNAKVIPDKVIEHTLTIVFASLPDAVS
jgi:hypothetical protein